MERPICPTCNKSFARKPNLNKHLRESKCCSTDINYENKQECLWCKGKYDNVKNHIKSCKTSKDVIYSMYQNEINNINTLKEQVKDLQDKLYNLANRTTVTNTINNTRTYNTILTCDKPLILNRERVLRLMMDYCSISHLKQGGKGICDWFLENVCVNERGLICIECFDKSRKIFKYEDDNEKIKEISGDEIVSLINSCYKDFGKSDRYKSFVQQVEEECDSNPKLSREEADILKAQYVDNIKYMKNEFIKRLIERTHKDSHNSSLGITYKDE